MLLKSSLQTFLNAFTFPDKTVYPVSSRNEKDFENLVSIYMDAVLHPLIYSQREIFDQEGWHFEISDDGSAYKNGVVFNEMKGAFTSVNTIIISEMNKLLYPDTCYGFESGGHPEHIGELTYERFIATHKKFYHPSNAHIFLDGDMPINKLLSLINDYLFTYTKQGYNITIKKQERAISCSKTVSYPVAEGSPVETMGILVKAFVVGNYLDTKKRIAFDLLTAYLAKDNDSPLTKAILEKGLAESIESFVNNDMIQPSLYFIFRNITEANKDEILVTVKKVLSEIVENGINKDRMKSIIDNAQFKAREGNSGWAPVAIQMALACLGTWNYEGDPITGLESEALFTSVREELENGYFEQLINDMLLHNENEATLLLHPDVDYETETSQLRRAKEAAEFEAMNAANKKIIIERLNNLRDKQKRADTAAELSTIPMLALSDVNRKPGEIPTEICENTIYHEIATKGIQYFNLYFPLGDFTKEAMPPLELAISLLCSMPTANYSAAEINRLAMSDLGNFAAEVRTYQNATDSNKAKVYAHVSVSCLAEKTNKVIKLVPEILLNTKFDDTKRIKSILAMIVESMRQSFISSGHQLAVKCANASLTAAGVIEDATSGMGLFRYLESVLKDFDNLAAELPATLKNLCNQIFTQNGLIVSISGKKDKAVASQIRAAFPQGDEKVSECLFAPSNVSSQGIEIPSSIGYAVSANHLSRLGIKATGPQKVLSQLLSLDYLWNEIRVKGGAYGTGLRFSDSGAVTFYTYRDPNPAGSLATFKATNKYIKNILSNKSDLTDIILGTIAGIDPLLTPGMMAQVGDDRYFSEITHSDLCAMRESVLDTTIDDILTLCDLMDKIVDSGTVCVVGGTNNLRECDLIKTQLL